VPDDDGAPYYYFTIDDQLVYLSFFQDWGPLNLAMVYKACILFHELLQVCRPGEWGAMMATGRSC
jgi:cell division cycle 14